MVNRLFGFQNGMVHTLFPIVISPRIIEPVPIIILLPITGFAPLWPCVSLIEKARKLNTYSKIGKMLAKFIKLRNRIVYACDIGITSEIPTDCVFHHSGLGVVIPHSLLNYQFLYS